VGNDKILLGDCIEQLKTLESDSIHCCVTSPPYWGLRDYGVAGQLGLERTPEEFVEKMVAVFREVRRVLRPDGSLWLNIGDCYATGAGSARSPGGKAFGKANDVVDAGAFPRSQPNRMPIAGLKPKDLVGVPWMLAFALRADGWYLRQEIIWHKPNPMPESIKDRCTKAHEQIFLLTKSARYFFDHTAIREPAKDASGWRKVVPAGWGVGDQPRDAASLQTERHHRKVAGKNSMRGQGHMRQDKNGPANREGRDMANVGVGLFRNKRSVWTVAPRAFKGAHFATFPPDLIQPCILAGSPAGGVVLDPFFGSGTTGVVARRQGRNFIGVELNEKYIEIAKSRLAEVETKLL
jgi:DNA modification methylase